MDGTQVGLIGILAGIVGLLIAAMLYKKVDSIKIENEMYQSKVNYTCEDDLKCGMNQTLEIGSKAPNFNLPNQNGNVLQIQFKVSIEWYGWLMEKELPASDVTDLILEEFSDSGASSD